MTRAPGLLPMTFEKSYEALRFGLALGTALLLLACGGGGGGGSSPPPPPPPSVSVSVSPGSASVAVGTTQQFTATVTGSTNTTVSWSVGGVSGGNSTVGTITAAGLYTAPSAIPVANPVTVSATSQADTTKSATATVTITVPPPPISKHPVVVMPNVESTGINIAVPSVTPTLQFIAVGIGTTAGSTGVEVRQGTTSAILFLVGNGFVEGTSYQFSGNPNDITVTQPSGTDFTQTADKTPIPAVKVRISVSSTAAQGPRNILVTNSAGELAVFVGGLLITPGP